MDRLEEALAALYGWYRENQRMERNVHRDRHLLPELDALMQENADPHLDAAAAGHAGSICGAGTAADSVRRLVRLALDFGTWALFAGQGMADAEIASLLRRAVAGAVP